MGSGMASGDNRAIEAATQAISSPVLENICIDGATGIIVPYDGPKARLLRPLKVATGHEGGRCAFESRPLVAVVQVKGYLV